VVAADGADESVLVVVVGTSADMRFVRVGAGVRVVFMARLLSGEGGCGDKKEPLRTGVRSGC
jgi:hypothetical protein